MKHPVGYFTEKYYYLEGTQPNTWIVEIISGRNAQTISGKGYIKKVKIYSTRWQPITKAMKLENL